MTTRPVRRPTRRRPDLVVGWREWVRLDGLGVVEPVKAKVDTGAATSALHAHRLERLVVDGEQWVRFEVHPHQRSSADAVLVTAPVVEDRKVRSSNGRSELRPVIHTLVTVGDRTWTVELTLTRRDSMGFRMLLGRQALRGHALVDPARSHVAGPPAPATGDPT